MDLNVDVVCNWTGEVLQEGVMLANAHIWIVKRDGKVVGDEVEDVEVDEIDGGGVIPLRTLWVELPEVKRMIERDEERRRGAAAWWQYEKEDTVDRDLSVLSWVK